MMGLGCTKQKDGPVAASSVVHSDNSIGDPAALSDKRLKLNQTVVPETVLTRIFDQIETTEYDLINTGTDVDGSSLPTERRVGFIADDVQAAIGGSDWSNIVGAKCVNNEIYKTLDYSRLVCVLWGHVKALTARVAALEA